MTKLPFCQPERCLSFIIVLDSIKAMAQQLIDILSLSLSSLFAFVLSFRVAASELLLKSLTLRRVNMFDERDLASQTCPTDRCLSIHNVCALFARAIVQVVP